MIDKLKVLDLLIRSYQHLRDYEAGDIDDDELEKRTDVLMEDIKNLCNDPNTKLSEEDEQAYYNVLNEYKNFKMKRKLS